MQNTSKVEELFKIADQNGIEVIYGFYPASKGVCCDGFIAMDYDMTDAEETVCFGHELGHCMTGAFYSLTEPALNRKRLERKAEKWAIKKLVPVEELKRALKVCPYYCDLAEYFGVTEDFIRKACNYYAESERLRDCS